MLYSPRVMDTQMDTCFSGPPDHHMLIRLFQPRIGQFRGAPHDSGTTAFSQSAEIPYDSGRSSFGTLRVAQHQEHIGS